MCLKRSNSNANFCLQTFEPITKTAILVISEVLNFDFSEFIQLCKTIIFDICQKLISQKIKVEENP